MMSSASYYARQVQLHVDGTPLFQTATDRNAEAETAQMLAQHWQCCIRSFGHLSPIDFFAERAGRIVAVLELKTRSHDSTKYPTVFLNLRKWLNLLLVATGLNVPALFVVRFTNEIRYIDVSLIDTRQYRVAGCRQMVKARNDIEPIIEVPVSSMQTLPLLPIAAVGQDTVDTFAGTGDSPLTHLDQMLDGTPVFKPQDVEERERQITQKLAAVWQCRMYSFGRMAPISWYAERNGKIAAVMEILTTPHTRQSLPLVPVPKRLWDALVLAQSYLALPGILVMQFADQLAWVNVANVVTTVVPPWMRQGEPEKNGIWLAIPAKEFRTIAHGAA